MMHGDEGREPVPGAAGAGPAAFGIPLRFYANLSWQSLGSLWGMAMGFAYAVLVGRALGVSRFGLLSVCLGFASVVFQCVELRLQEAVIKFLAEFWEQRDGPRTLATVKLSLLTDAVTGLLAFIVLLALAPWAGEHLAHDTDAVAVLWLAGLAVLCANVATATALGLLRIFERFRVQALVTVIGSTLKLGATMLALWELGWGVRGVLLVAVATSFVTNAVLIGAGLHALSRHVPLRATAAPLRLLRGRVGEMRRFVLNTYFLSLSMIPTKDLDVNVLAWVTSLEVVGVYKIAKNLLAALFALCDAAFLVVYPELARMWARRQFGLMREFLRRLTSVLGVGGVVLYVLGCVLVPPVIRVLLGPAYADAGPLFRWMAFGIVVWAPLLWLNPLLMAAGRPDLTLVGSIGGSIVVLGLYLALVPPYGGVGAAIVSGLSTPIVLGLIWWLAWRRGPLASVLTGRIADGIR